MQGATNVSKEEAMKEQQLPELPDSCSAQGLFAQLFSDSWETSPQPYKALWYWS